MAPTLIGQRLRALREEKGLSQDELSGIFGFKDRQTLSAIELGERRLSADELLIAAQKLNASLDYFTDPFCLVGEGQFSWRQTSVSAAVLNAYQRVAGQIIAAFRALSAELGEKPQLMRQALKLTKQARFEDAAEAGERFAVERQLGDVPASRLIEVMENDLSILVLMISPSDQGISGAACRLPELDVVLINRHESPGRRHFDLAHELFHILTWDVMPPAHVEDTSASGSKSRVEQLADAFASALLMPARIITSARNWKGLVGESLYSALNAVADRIQVSAWALFWRLVSLGLLNKLLAQDMRPEALRNNGRATSNADVPPLFSRKFVGIIGRALEEGRVSVRKIAGILGLSIDELADVFAAQGVPVPYEL